MNKNYFPYHIHSSLSLNDSATNYKEYVNKAKELGQTAIAFSEHGNIYNFIEKKMYCDSMGIKYVHACEIYLTALLEHPSVDNTKYKFRDNFHTILIAKNKEGFLELNSIISKAGAEDHFYFKPRVTFEEFLNISDNVIKISACLASPLNVKHTISRLKEKICNSLKETEEKIKKNNDSLNILKIELETSKEKDKKRIEQEIKNIESNTELNKEVVFKIKDELKWLDKKIEELFKKYDYYEVQYHVNSDEQKEYNKFLLKQSKKYNKPIIAGTDTHSINQYKAECRNILLKGKKIEFSNEDTFDLTYKTYDELVEQFKQQGVLTEEEYLTAIENTNILCNSIDDLEIDTSIKYPNPYGNDEEVYIERVHKMFNEKVEMGIIPQDEIEQYKKDIEEELRVFKKVNMCGFMLSMSDICMYARNNGHPLGPLRGSSGGSRCAYITDIIDADPVKWKTVFSRFCNEDRVEIGDIDIDIYEDDRPYVYDFIINKFGKDKTAYVLALGTVDKKGTIDLIGRALQYELSFVDKIKKEFEQDEESCRNKYKELFYYFDGIVGTYVSQSIHAAGIVAAPITLDDNYGTFYSKERNGKVLQLDMDNVHECGLAKYDLLGLKTIGIIKKACEYAKIPYPKSYQLNWEDEKVWDDIKKNKVGIFQFEGDYAFRVLKDFDAKSILDMTLVTAMIRPSGASYRDNIIKKIFHKNPNKKIDELFSDTYGYLVYQEQTIKFLQEICGLSGSESDNVRRAIGRKQVDRLQKALPDILNGYCKNSDKPRKEAEEEAKQFLKVVEDSASYQFGYNHAIGYSMIGYICGYLRYYYPIEFITAMLNCSKTEEDFAMGSALAEFKGIKIKEPRFRTGKSEYSFNKEKNEIYKGMKSIKYLNEDCANGLYLFKDKSYEYFSNLLYDIFHDEQCKINTKQLEILIRLDFFKEFGNSNELLYIYENFQKFKNGNAKSFSKSKTNPESILYSILKRNSTETEKTFTKLNAMNIVREIEEYIKCQNLKDIPIRKKMETQKEYLGYINLVTEKPEDRPKIIVLEKRVLVAKTGKNAGKPWCVVIDGQSIGSGKKSSYTIYYNNYIYNKFEEFDVIRIKNWHKKNDYYYIDEYEREFE